MAKIVAAQSVLFSKYGLIFFTGLLFTSGYFIWQIWPSLIISSMQWQKEVYGQLSDLLYDAHANKLSAGLSLIGLSFIYGILHSIGPGHGKLIVSTYIATHPTKVKISLILTILSALLQAIVAIALVSILLIVFNSSMHEINSEATRFVSLSFYIVVILGLVIIWRSIATLCKASPFRQSQKHKHFADPKAINNASSFKEYAVIILSIGIRPCTGAIMVLLFANLVDIYWLGVISAFVMAIGTAITTSAIAIMTISGKKLVTRYINNNKSKNDRIHKNNTSKGRLAGPLIQLTGGLILILMGALLLSSQPVGMSPLF